jgi:limonene-1,2-epoxide hydrolase
MRTGHIAAVVLMVLLVLPLTAYAQQADPAAVVAAYYEAALANDIDATLALMADDAVVDMPGFGTYTGLEEIRAWMEGLIALNFEMRFEILQVERDTVTLKSWYNDDDFRTLGVVLAAEEQIVVQEGKIVSDTWIVTEESMAELQAAMAGLPVTGGRPFSSGALLMVVGGLAISGRLCLYACTQHLSGRVEKARSSAFAH